MKKREGLFVDWSAGSGWEGRMLRHGQKVNNDCPAFLAFWYWLAFSEWLVESTVVPVNSKFTVKWRTYWLDLMHVGNYWKQMLLWYGLTKCLHSNFLKHEFISFLLKVKKGQTYKHRKADMGHHKNESYWFV